MRCAAWLMEPVSSTRANNSALPGPRAISSRHITRNRGRNAEETAFWIVLLMVQYTPVQLNGSANELQSPISSFAAAPDTTALPFWTDWVGGSLGGGEVGHSGEATLHHTQLVSMFFLRQCAPFKRRPGGGTATAESRQLTIHGPQNVTGRFLSKSLRK